MVEKRLVNPIRELPSLYCTKCFKSDLVLFTKELDIIKMSPSGIVDKSGVVEYSEHMMCNACGAEVEFIKSGMVYNTITSLSKKLAKYNAELNIPKNPFSI